MKKILLITKISTYPVRGGECLRSENLIKLLNLIGYSVFAIVGNTRKINLNNYETENLKLYELPKSNLNSIIDMMLINKSIIELANKLIKKNDIRTVFFDYGFLGSYIEYFSHLNIIYGTHNSQSNLTKQWNPSGLRSKFSKYIQYYLQRRHERQYFNKADKLIVVSAEDKGFHSQFVDQEKIVVIPNLLDEKNYTVRENKENYIVMSANFKTYQNSDGLSWFIKNVWNSELSSITRLKIVGIGSTNLDFLKGIENVDVCGEVDNIKPYIQKAMLAIVPLLHGSGSRLKVLEAMALQTQVISTRLGCEGIDYNFSILIADDAISFRNKIVNVLNMQTTNHTDEGYKVFLEKYSLNSQKSNMAKVLYK